jgi:hypothetical protein
MPYRYGQAGKSTYRMAEKRHQRMIWIAAIGIVICLILLFIFKNAKDLGIGGIGFIVILELLQVLPDWLDGILGKKQKEEKRARRGAAAEVRVDSLLEELDENYLVLNDISSRYGNIDHVVISRYGSVFLIETKSHGGSVTIQDGQLLVNGKFPEKDFIKQTLNNTYWLREQLVTVTGFQPWITPFIVFTNAFVNSSPPIRGVMILNRKFLISQIERISNHNAGKQKLWEYRQDIAKKLVE